MAVPAFSAQELEQSLTEVSWGIASWEVLPPHFCAAGEARAKVDLLEPGDQAVLAVSSGGWKICLRSVADISVGPTAFFSRTILTLCSVAFLQRLPEDSAAKDVQNFEDLDHLLAYLSPSFETKRIQLLSDKLENLAVTRNWGQDHEHAGGNAGGTDVTA